jgi:hypothetical protein
MTPASVGAGGVHSAVKTTCTTSRGTGSVARAATHICSSCLTCQRSALRPLYPPRGHTPNLFSPEVIDTISLASTILSPQPAVLEASPAGCSDLSQRVPSRGSDGWYRTMDGVQAPVRKA